jgi:predicted  nucleic acid-binding Zn-ribbon protein
VALDKRTGRIQGEVAKLRGAVLDLQRDIESVRQELASIKVDISKSLVSGESSTTVYTLDDRLTRVTTTVEEVVKQVATFGARFDKEIGKLKWDLRQQEQEIANLRGKVRGSVLTTDYAEDMANLRAEMAEMRQQLDESRARETARSETAFPSRELEALTGTIAKISSRASQIETLQMEVEILKGRFERSEAGRQVTEDNRSARAIDSGLPRYSGVYSATRKRGASPSLEHAPKRPASSLGH